MIGQEKLLSILDTYTLETLPKTLLFIGEEGSGRKTIITRLANRLCLPVVMVDDNIDFETILEYQRSVIKRMYCIDIDNFTEKMQNQFLKFIEEPAENVYISIIAETENNVLETVLNRCIKFYIKPYSEVELRQVRDYPDSLIYEICRTPGKIIAVDYRGIQDLYKFCTKLVQGVQKASYANLLSVSAKINYKEDWTKYDFYTFFDVLKKASLDEFFKTNSPQAFTIYTLTTKYTNKFAVIKPLRENFVLSFLSNMWLETRKYHDVSTT